MIHYFTEYERIMEEIEKNNCICRVSVDPEHKFIQVVSGIDCRGRVWEEGLDKKTLKNLLCFIFENVIFEQTVAGIHWRWYHVG